MKYNAPVNETQFFIRTIGEIEQILKLIKDKDLDIETIDTIINEFGKFISDNWSLTNKIGDKFGSKLESGKVISDISFKKAYDNYIKYGWNALKSPKKYGGQELPMVINSICTEFLCAGNLSLSLLIMLTNSAIEAIKLHASDELKDKFLFNLVNGKWSGTMNLTEPQAGSDLSKINTKAIKNKDNNYLISGKKIFITWGDHELTENIIHLVLARLPDSPEGVKGLSLFISPKFMVNDDGSLGQRNNINIISLEKKLGIHASPTCIIEYDNAQAYLVGEADKGLNYMFTMMNLARLEVGIEAVGVSDIAFQYARSYSNQRMQGTKINSNNFITINQHPDVKRMLLVQKAYITGLRALYIYTTSIYDIYNYEKDIETKTINKNILEFMVPIIKAFSSENGILLTNTALQVFGGMGYIEETGVAQFVRDIRITSIYEGTNGIQALDFIKRKTFADQGSVAKYMIYEAKIISKNISMIENTLSTKLNYYIELINQLIKFNLNNYEKYEYDKSLIGSFPYLMAFGTFLGGFLLAKSYIKTNEFIKNNDFKKFNKEFLINQMNITNIYFDHVLPNIDLYYKQVKFGSQSILNYKIEHI